MKRTKRHQKLRRCLRAVSPNLSKIETQKKKSKDVKNQVKHYQYEKHTIMKNMFDLQREYGLFEYSMHEYMKPIRKHFGNRLNEDGAQT